jgi:hypothetical protein
MVAGAVNVACGMRETGGTGSVTVFELPQATVATRATHWADRRTMRVRVMRRRGMAPPPRTWTAGVHGIGFIIPAVTGERGSREELRRNALEEGHPTSLGEHIVRCLTN